MKVSIRTIRTSEIQLNHFVRKKITGLHITASITLSKTKIHKGNWKSISCQNYLGSFLPIGNLLTKWWFFKHLFNYMAFDKVIFDEVILHNVIASRTFDRLYGFRQSDFWRSECFPNSRVESSVCASECAKF